MTMFTQWLSNYHEPVKGYFEMLLRAITRRWSVSPDMIELTGTGTPAETVLEEVERKVISQSGPTAGEDADDSNPVVEQITVPLERWDVYSHLRALCNNDPRFSIWGNVKTDEDLENVTIWHTQAITQGKSPAGRRGIIGTVQLLPAGSDTVIMFVAKDALHYEKITDGGKVLFREFIQLVKRHFDELTRQQVRTEPSPPTEDSAVDLPPMEDPTGGKYGTCRDLTIDDVRDIVKRCRAFQAKDGKITEFYRRGSRDFSPGEPRSYELETLRGWLKNPRFAPKDTKKLT
jgi:hypothetical protein